MRFDKVSFEQYLIDSSNDVLIVEGETERKIAPSNPMEVYEGIKLPKRATKKSAGYDFYAPYDFTLHPGDTIKLSTGIRVLLDDNKFLMCAPRSSHGFKARIQLDNTIGIIDADYSESENEGHIMLKLTNDSHTGKILHVSKGEGMMQAIIMHFYRTEDDDADAKRNGGFGSTNNK